MTERTDSRFAARRRRVLASIGLATGAGALAGVGGARDGADIVLRQGSRCIPVRPLSGDESVVDLYDFRIRERYATPENGGSDPGDGPYYASAGTQSLQSPNTSILFLYDGPEGLSLVMVHGNVGDDSGGSVTFEFQGLPDDGRFVVKDDYYVDPGTGQPTGSNYDSWRVDASPVRVDWTWGPDRTDGGAFRALDGGLSVTVTPAFNQEAALYGEQYEGTVERWELLTGGRPSPQRVALDMSQPISIERGTCDSGGTTGGGGGTGTDETPTETPTDGGGDGQGDRQQTEQQRKQQKHRKKREKQEKKHRKKQRKHRQKHERKQRKHEKKEERKRQKHQKKDDE